ncbi:Epididymal-specific lipocalin-6 [Lemmus lemmus]
MKGELPFWPSLLRGLLCVSEAFLPLLPRPDGCQSTVELLKQDSRWVFENPAIGVLDYRVLGTNFKDYAVIFTQLEFGDEAFNTVELYSRTEVASYEAMKLFTKWSQGLGFCSQQQAQLRKDLTCTHKILQVGHLFCTTLDSLGSR